MAEQYGFYVNTARCVGCKTCQIACKDKNDLEPGILFRRVYEYGGGSWQEHADGTYSQDVFTYYTSLGCNHCQDAACIKVCPSGAAQKNEKFGTTWIDPKVCIGCRSCVMACPYGAPRFDATKGYTRLCNGCTDLVSKGKSPACVAACPQRALEFGKMADLRAKYGKEANIAPLPSSKLTRPSLCLTPSPNARPSGDASGSLQNPKEVSPC